MSLLYNEIFIQPEDWGAAFFDYYRDNEQAFLKERGLFAYIDVDSCYHAIKKGSIKDISDFRRAIHSIYNFSNINEYYTADIENIEKLNCMLEGKFEGRMKQYNIKLLQDDLSAILEHLIVKEL